MGSRSAAIRWPSAPVLAALVAAGLLASAIAASAASLGGENANDLLVDSSSETVPLPLAYDHFDGCGGNLNGDVDVADNPWTAPSTNWWCQSAWSRSRNNDQGPAADSATVDVGKSDQVVVSTFLERASRTANGAGSGVSLFHDGGSDHIYIVYQRGADQITVGKIDGSGDTEILSWGWLPRSDTIEFLIEIDQPDLTVYADGTLLGTYTMTAGELATFGSNSRFGMESDLDRRSRWAWFQVEDLLP